MKYEYAIVEGPFLYDPTGRSAYYNAKTSTYYKEIDGGKTVADGTEKVMLNAMGCQGWRFVRKDLHDDRWRFIFERAY